MRTFSRIIDSSTDFQFICRWNGRDTYENQRASQELETAIYQMRTISVQPSSGKETGKRNHKRREGKGQLCLQRSAKVGMEALSSFFL